jgi:hypothetical protein
MVLFLCEAAGQIIFPWQKKKMKVRNLECYQRLKSEKIGISRKKNTVQFGLGFKSQEIRLGVETGAKM